MFRNAIIRLSFLIAVGLGCAGLGWSQAPAPASSSSASSAAPAPDNNESQAYIGIPGLVFGKSTVNGQTLSTTGTLGIAAGLRLHITGRSWGEFRYAYSSDTHNYLPTWSEQAHLYEFTGNYVYQIATVAKHHIFALGGVSAMNFGLTSNAGNVGAPAGGGAVTSQTKRGFDYGVGVDRELTENLNLRFEVREFSYKQPDFGIGTATGARFTSWGQLTEPSLGLVYHF